MSGDDAAETPPAGALPVMKKVGAALLLAFCCWHAVFLLASIAPPKNAANGKPNTALALYKLFVSGPQQWNLFESIPDHHWLDPRIVVEDSRGGQTTIGCVLPGFTAYPRPEKARYYNLFFRLLTNAERPSFFAAYLRRVEAGLPAWHDGALPGRWELVVDVEWTRTLLHSRRDGGLYVPATRSFDVANPRGIVR